MEGKTFKIVGNDISDGYHTFDELYEHRCLLWINLVLSGYAGEAFYVKDHFEGWDLIGAGNNHTGQISYHVPAKYRGLYAEKLKAKTIAQAEALFDGHTSIQVIERLVRLAAE